jgi:hypothetical protein
MNKSQIPIYLLEKILNQFNELILQVVVDAGAKLVVEEVVEIKVDNDTPKFVIVD